MQQYPMVDGFIWDGPEWGYEIAASHQDHRSYFFHDLPPSVRKGCSSLGFDYDRLVAAKDRLYATLHNLDADSIALHAPGGLLGGFNLFGADPDLMAWMQFRTQALTNFFHTISREVKQSLGRPIKMAVGPRSAAFAPLCGYDFQALASGEFPVDILMPKHYFYHRGFDGMLGTVGRWVEVLCDWNSSLRESDALRVVESFFGLKLPCVDSLLSLESALTPDFFSTVVYSESARALAAVGGDASRVVPWVDTGR
jgi:hypothetical protein